MRPDFVQPTALWQNVQGNKKALYLQSFFVIDVFCRFDFTSKHAFPTK
jgi:hypothetical protein